MKKAQNRKPAKPKETGAPSVVGRVTSEERDEIQALFERKNGLRELVLMLQQNGGLQTANSAFYEKLVADVGRTTTRFQKWWSDKAETYGWPSELGKQWTINFENCEIRLSK